MKANRVVTGAPLVFAFVCGLLAAACSSYGDTDDLTGDKDKKEEASEPGGPSTKASSSSSGGADDNATGDPQQASANGGAPYPIVLLHGMAGFVKTTGPMQMEYFNGVVQDLTSRGELVFTTLTTPYATSETRVPAIAQQIEEILKKTGKAKVNLIGHSQGGLDARVLASPNGSKLGGSKIASVTTISTPHRGSPVADLVLANMDKVPGGGSILDKLTDVSLMFAQKMFYEVKDEPQLREQLIFLGVNHMVNEFNPKYVNDPKVVYLSYAGRTNGQPGTGVCDDGEEPNDPTKLDTAQLSMRGTAKFLENGQGIANDGMCTIESSKWGKFQKCVAADHLKEVQGEGFDQLAFFREVAARIRKEGL